MRLRLALVSVLLIVTACHGSDGKNNADLTVGGDAGGPALDLSAGPDVAGGDLAEADLVPPPPDMFLPPSTCNFPPITGDRNVTFDLHTVTVSGAINLDGVTMPDNTQDKPRGAIMFYNLASRSSASADLTATGAATYSLTMFPGTYDVYLTSYSASDQNVLPPAQSMRLATGVVVGATQTNDFNAATATLSGTITVDGAAMPDTANDARADIVLSYSDGFAGTTTTISLPPTGPAAYSQKVFAGHYTMALAPTYDTGPIPYLGVSLGSVTALGPTTHDVALTTATVSGEITVGDAVMADDTVSRGGVYFVSGSNTFFVDVGAAGPATYSAKIWSGTYDVLLLGAGGKQKVLPSSSGTLLQGKLAVSGTMTKTYNVDVFTVSGTVTANGDPVADDTAERGRIAFTDANLNTTTFSLGKTGDATYSGLLFAGTYEVSVGGVFGAEVAIPKQSTTLETGVAISADRAKDYDMTIVTLDGEVKINGATMPDDTYERGQIAFRSRTGMLSYQFPSTGPASYTLSLFAGTYTVILSGNNVQTTIPEGSVIMAKNVAVAASGTHSYDVAVSTLHASINVNGAPLADDSVNRGFLSYDAFMAGTTSSKSLGQTGATVDVPLYHGSYDLFIGGAPKATALPNTGTTLARGCVDATGCDKWRGDLSGTWELANYIYFGDLALSQTGAQVTGDIDYFTKLPRHVTLGAGSSDGNNVSLADACPLIGTVDTGCFMHGVVGGGCQPREWSASR